MIRFEFRQKVNQDSKIFCASRLCRTKSLLLFIHPIRKPDIFAKLNLEKQTNVAGRVNLPGQPVESQPKGEVNLQFRQKVNKM
jgi:hypothetical protein